ncbi:MAG: glycosyltransferase family 10 [Acidobacteriota bacterium]
MAAAGPNPPTVTFFNSFFKKWPSGDGLEEAHMEVTFGHRHAESADAVVFHLPTLQRGFIPQHPKPAGQLWVAWCLESRETCPALGDPETRRRFDLFMTHESSADVWAPYFGPWCADDLLRPPAPKREAVAAVHLQSNPYDACGRNRYVFDLMRRMRIDSCGKVLTSRRREVAPGWKGRTELMARYKFTLAMENSISEDYVTDKFFDPLRVGSVPVYRGSADVKSLAPHPDCYIDAADFASPAELADYLRWLDRNDDAYARFHGWREQGFSPRFQSHLDRLQRPTFIRLAEAIAERPAAKT